MSGSSLYRSQEGERAIMAYYDSLLARWPVPHENLNISTRFGNTFVIASGNRSQPNLVLLHGAGSFALSWMRDVPGYCQDFRVYAVDLPGEPGRSTPVRPNWNSRDYADWLDDLRRGLNIEKTSLIGLSQGGWAALKYAVEFPAKIDRLVLLSPAGITTDRISFLLRAVWYSWQGKTGARTLSRLTIGPQPVNETAVKFIELIMTYFKPRIGKLVRFTDAELGRLNFPVLLIGGKLDAIRDVNKIADRLDRLLPKLTAHIHPDRGHILLNLSGEILPFLVS